MKTCIVVKVVRAEPMTRGAWANRTDLPGADYGADGYMVVDAGDGTSWFPKTEFEEAYIEVPEGAADEIAAAGRYAIIRRAISVSAED